MSLGGRFNKYGTAPKNLTDTQCQTAFDTLRSRVEDVLPFSNHDSNVISDDDALIKFLIARKYNVDKAEEMLRNSIKWRSQFGCEAFPTFKFPESLADRSPSAFYGMDKEGHPVYIEQPDGNNIRAILNELGEEQLFRWHIYTIERQRQITKHWKTDRISIILDASHITLGIVTNTQATGFLKRISTHDQEVYPEGMRYMFVVNAPAAVTIAWRFISPFLDPVVREKIHIWGTGFLQEIGKYIDPAHLPRQLGGGGGDWYRLTGDATSYVIPEPPATDTS